MNVLVQLPSPEHDRMLSYGRLKFRDLDLFRGEKLIYGDQLSIYYGNPC